MPNEYLTKWADQHVHVDCVDGGHLTGVLGTYDEAGGYFVLFVQPDKHEVIVYLHAVRSIRLFTPPSFSAV